MLPFTGNINTSKYNCHNDSTNYNCNSLGRGMYLYAMQSIFTKSYDITWASESDSISGAANTCVFSRFHYKYLSLPSFVVGSCNQTMSLLVIWDFPNIEVYLNAVITLNSFQCDCNIKVSTYLDQTSGARLPVYLTHSLLLLIIINMIDHYSLTIDYACLIITMYTIYLQYLRLNYSR